MNCVICNSSSDGYPLCNNCKPKALLKDSCCSLCGIYTGSIIKTCVDCSDKLFSNQSLFPYSGIPKVILNLYKFYNYKELGLYYSELLLEVVNKDYQGWTIVPIPPSRIKKRQKGWYQLDPILKKLVNNGVAVEPILYKKERKSQKRLNREERSINVTGSFYIKKIKKLDKILLLDDVYTTGATLTEAVKLLKSKGYTDIKSLTLCRD